MKVHFFAVFMLASVIGYGQSPRVPVKMEFAGLKLRITESARKEIQKDVDALTKYPKYYEIKAEKARSYFPIIERVFREENLPDDFKYLVLQESALIPDAVSSSNAVGFWQFKDFTAVEVGLKINRNVDERMNIVSSSRGAARYLKKNNSAFFGNWLHALQAYQSGAGAALKVLDKKYRGATSMVIDKKTYWYVKKYLAHKIAFNGVGDRPGSIKLVEYYNGANKTLKEIAKEVNAEEEELIAYNKWVRRSRIPEDKKYAVVIPMSNDEFTDFVASNDSPTPAKKSVKKPQDFKNESVFPNIKDKEEASTGKVVTINGLPGILASQGDKIPVLAKKGNVDLSKFLKYNDLQIDSKLQPAQVYYLKAKKNKAKTHYHIANQGETLWTISQKYGIKLKKLRSKNRMSASEKLKAGRVLWLRYIRPAKTEIEYKELPDPKIEEEVIVKVNENKQKNKEENEPVKVEEAQEATPSLEEEQKSVSSEVDAKEIDLKLDSLNAIQPESEQQEEIIEEVVEEKKIDTDIEEKSIEVQEKNVEEIENKVEQIDDKEKPFVKTTVKTHVIEVGQTYYSVSKLYDVEVMKILEWNNLDISDKLSIGQELVIHQEVNTEKQSEERPVKEEFKYHVVKEGEGLYGIARSYDVTIQDVMDWNEKENFDISVGEKLKIKKKDTQSK